LTFFNTQIYKKLHLKFFVKKAKYIFTGFRTDMTNSINFRAKFIKNDYIKNFDKINNTYKPLKVAIVELDSKKQSDIFAISNICKNWKKAKYIDSIIRIMKCIFSGFLDKDERKIYALTTQKKHYDQLQSDKILGITEIDLSKGEGVYLDYIQVNPDFLYTNTNPNRKYKNIGKCILDFIKDFYKKEITLCSDYRVIDFYEKNGFKSEDESNFCYQWKPEI